MKALKTTLGLFLLSLFLFSFIPQKTATENTKTAADQIQLQDTYAFEDLTGNEEQKRGGNE